MTEWRTCLLSMCKLFRLFRLPHLFASSCVAHFRPPLGRGLLRTKRKADKFDVRPGAFWAESFPILKLIPDCLAPWKREVKRRAKDSTEMLSRLATDVRDQIKKGNAPASFTKTLWEKREGNPEALSEREIAYATGSLFGAGSDTSSATLMSFFLAMTCFPRVAAEAQEELDRVVGRDRSPTWSDEPNLPYCRAVIKETLRWRPVAVMGGTPHASIKDDQYNGHFIPKGTTILGNLWAIHHNEKYFKDSHDFIPERYLRSGQVDGMEPYPHRDGHSAFGWVGFLFHPCTTTPLRSFCMFLPFSPRPSPLQLSTVLRLFGASSADTSWLPGTPHLPR